MRWASSPSRSGAQSNSAHHSANVRSPSVTGVSFSVRHVVVHAHGALQDGVRALEVVVGQGQQLLADAAAVLEAKVADATDRVGGHGGMVSLAQMTVAGTRNFIHGLSTGISPVTVAVREDCASLEDPASSRHRPGRPEPRTHRLLLAHAMTLVRRGHIPSVPELAVKARVSRATAYRYFPSRSKLVSAVVAEGPAPVRRYEPKATDGLGRVRSSQPHVPALQALRAAHARRAAARPRARIVRARGPSRGGAVSARPSPFTSSTGRRRRSPRVDPEASAVS